MIGVQPITCARCGGSDLLVCVIQGAWCQNCGAVTKPTEEQLRQLYDVIERPVTVAQDAEHLARCLTHAAPEAEPSLGGEGPGDAPALGGPQVNKDTPS